MKITIGYWILFLINFIISFLCLVVSIFYLYKCYSKFRTREWYHKRLGSYMIGFGGLCVGFCALNLASAFGTYPPYLGKKGLKRSYEKLWLLIIAVVIRGFFAVVVGISFIFVYFYRCWMVYFRINYNYLTFLHSWKSIIDPVTYTSDQSKNFFVAKLSTLGNSSFVKTWLFIVNAIIIFVIMVVGPFWRFTCYNECVFVYEIIWVFATLPTLLLGVVIAYCAHHLHKFATIYDDNIGFRQEIAQTSKAVFLMGLSILIIALCTVGKLIHRVIGITVGIHLYNIFSLYYCVFTISWVIYKNEFATYDELFEQQNKSSWERLSDWFARPIRILSSWDVNNDAKRLIIGSVTRSSDKSHKETPTPIPDKSPSISNQWSLGRVLKDPGTIDLFMNHLGKEYSMELLLSVIEMGQFINEMKKKCGHEWDDEGKKSVLEKRAIELTDDLPQSVLVFDSASIQAKISQLKEDQKSKQDWDDTMLYFKIIACDIFKKYIKVGAKYEINIAYDERVRLTNLLGNETLWLLTDTTSIAKTRGTNFNPFHRRTVTAFVTSVATTQQLSHIFDHCVSEMYKLLRQSYVRFEQSQEFLMMSRV